MKRPIAATVAGAEPEMAPNTVEAPIVVRPCAPRTPPMIDMHQSRMRFDMPPTPMIFPGKQEERHGEERELVDRAEERLVRDRERHVHEEQQQARRGGEQDDEDRESEEEQDERENEDEPGHRLLEGAEGFGDLLLTAAVSLPKTLRTYWRSRKSTASSMPAKPSRHPGMRERHRDLGGHAALVYLPCHARRPSTTGRP